MTDVASFTMATASCGTTRCGRRAQSPSPSLPSLSLRTHRWPWHTHRRVRNHLYPFLTCTSNNSTAKRMSLLRSRIPLRHASRHIHQLTATQSVNATQSPRMTVPHTPTRHPTTRRKQCLDNTKRVAPDNDSPLQAVRQDSSATIKQPAFPLLIPPCTRFRLSHASSVTPGLSMSKRKRYAPLGSTRSPLTILSQSSPWAMHEEHHGKNAQKISCRTPTHSASTKSMAPDMGFARILASASLRGLPYTHIARDHSEGKVAPPVRLSIGGTDQSTVQKSRKSLHISKVASAPYAANAQHGRGAISTHTQHTDTKKDSWEKQH
ncbi:hypothetical protein Tc00.1047053509281.30 [Trypanosoma cruzi]|uniref:Uncharacterized protein n=1 Tax=Trypanosoma cruzi (strain CL Brener) TaxID=353153 RepID=Q4CSS1_TRYCC|nr:hypothetical protein Tc00.1047053509281.30 [Trypanosoma cruzi]EAN83325.1 hypothetical protein Tc00.1047053509281.30 [Trypanosoma cruzi]|eukprot:XP_805176.1 hypothetical protein [Trypanosoma cruzi strain CL Brener]